VSLSDDIDEAATRGAAAELVALFNNLVKCGVPQAQRRVCEHAVDLVGRDVRVHPAVLGEIYEQCIAHPERHARGVHFTAERELAGVIEPTIVAPWRRRVAAATVDELVGVHKELVGFSVLDPACGSGNFLYAAFLALLKIEAEVVGRLREVGVAVVGRVRVGQCRGIDRSPLAAELARATLRIAAARFGREGEVDVQVGDALFMPWGEVDAIVGNPPFVAKNKLVPELGREYVQRLRAAYPEVSGRADYCVYFFRKSHDALKVGGRAGLIGTNTIRQNDSRAGGLDYIVGNGGSIVDAVATRVWPGDAVVHVSVVNWVKGTAEGPRVLARQVGDDVAGAFERVEVAHIGASLSERDVTGAAALACNVRPKNFFQGQTHGCKGFLLTLAEAAALGRDERARAWLVPYLIGDDLLGGRPSRFAIDASAVEDVRELEECAGVYRRLFNEVLPEVRRKADGDPQRRAHLKEWWKFWRARPELLARLRGMRRYIVCVRVTRRPIFAFVDAAIRPNDALQAFTFEDDYSFGVLQSRLHWEWFVERCSTLKRDYRYTSETVWRSFPWPQAPEEAVIREVAAAARELRRVRDACVAEVGSLRAVYRGLEGGGSCMLRECQEALDRAVRGAYSMGARADGVLELLRLNAEVAAARGDVRGPGLPVALRGDASLCSEDRLAIASPWS
jgi:hypothetical protein